MTERILVTGANGCIGAWVVKALVAEGATVVAFDKVVDERRHRLVNAGALPDVIWHLGDLTVLDDVMAAAEGATRIIHLAALQVPFCRANPSLGASVNVTGTVNVFEAARHHGVQQVAHASSIAVFGRASDYGVRVLPADAPRLPSTLYGAYKVAGEDLAKVYWADHGVRSVGLRPHTVFGPGRDQGMTSLPSVAIEKAVRGESFHVEFGGALDFQYAPDVAEAFVHAARVEVDGAPTYTIGGHVRSVADFLATVREVTGFDDLTCGTEPLPLVDAADASAWFGAAGGPAVTPLRDAIASSATVFAAV
ncbi:MAG: NAD-dependent epimerase/dehydratase family protein [Ilumatobacteraceae bacterium]